MTADHQPPLHGVRVLDLTRILAGPYATMQFGDLGAEVIKVEVPDGGDDTRQMKPPEAGGESHFFLALNRNKRSIALDMKTAEGREIIQRLAAKSQVLVENFRPGVMKRLGLDYESIRERHPHLIYCSISSYGQTGVMSDRPGFDPVLQAEMGFMAITGQPDGEPMRHPLAIIDLSTALYTTSAVLAAIIAQRESGHGQYVEVSLLGSALGLLSNFGQYYLTGGEEPPRMGNNHPVAVPVGLFHAKDGNFYMACATNRQFATLCEKVLKNGALKEDPRFATPPDRIRNKNKLFAVLDGFFGRDTLTNWLARMRAEGVPAGPVRSLSEALESPEVAGGGFLTTVDHSTAGSVRMVASPFKFSASGIAAPVAPPTLGQHTEEILREVLEMEDAGIAALRKAGAIP